MKKQKGEAISAFAVALFAIAVWLGGLASNNYTKLQDAEQRAAQAEQAAKK